MSGLAAFQQNQRGGEEKLINEYAPLVKKIAYHLISRLPPSIQPDDLIQAGMIGLLEAARNYDSDQGASFETYAGIRIRGAMLDEIRRSDWAPRSVHKKARMVSEAIREIENETGRDARDQEVADRLGMTLNDYHQVLRDANGYRVVSFDELSPADELASELGHADHGGPLDGLQKQDFKRCLSEAISGLPERERLVLALYYDEELNLREIGEVLGVSESRICQIHGQAVMRLKARMEDWRKD